MVQHRKIKDPRDELRALRARVQVLERELETARAIARERHNASPTAAERALAGFFEQPVAMLFIADLVEGRYLRVNGKVCEVLGYSEKELLETSFLDRVHPDDRRKTMREMQRLVAGKQTAHFRNRHRDARGNWHSFEWTAVADPDGELCYAMAVEVK